jgi:hypothetical protein
LRFGHFGVSRSSIKMCMCIEGADSWACCGRGIGFDPQVGERAADKSWETISTLSAIKKPSTLKSSLLLGRDNLSTFARQLVPWRGKAAGSPVRGSERAKGYETGKAAAAFLLSLSLSLFFALHLLCFCVSRLFPLFSSEKNSKSSQSTAPFLHCPKSWASSRDRKTSTSAQKPRARAPGRGAPCRARGGSSPCDASTSTSPAAANPRRASVCRQRWSRSSSSISPTTRNLSTPHSTY